MTAITDAIKQVRQWQDAPTPQGLIDLLSDINADMDRSRARREELDRLIESGEMAYLPHWRNRDKVAEVHGDADVIDLAAYRLAKEAAE